MCLPSSNWLAWDYTNGSWQGSKRESRSVQNLLLCFLGKASPKSIPNSRGGEIDSTSWWGNLSKGVDAGISRTLESFLQAIYHSPIFFLPLSSLSCPALALVQVVVSFLEGRDYTLYISASYASWASNEHHHYHHCHSVNGEFIPGSILITFQYISWFLWPFSI